jgi:hypothetical protein
MDEKTRQEAQAIIAEAKAYKGLITVLTRRLEQSEDPRVKMALAELRQDREWQAFTRWYEQRGSRRIARKTRKQQEKKTLSFL